MSDTIEIEAIGSEYWDTFEARQATQASAPQPTTETDTTPRFNSTSRLPGVIIPQTVGDVVAWSDEQWHRWRM